MRAEIEARMALDAVDIYGLSEVMGPGVAQECVESKDGPVIWEDHFYPEIIDPQTGAVLPEGEEGELVFTSLTKEALPVIRYRTRDLTRLLPPTARAMRRMAKIVGRSRRHADHSRRERVSDADRGTDPESRGLAPHYQLEVSRDGHLDSLTVNVECAPGRSAGPEASRSELSRAVKAYVGVSVAVTCTRGAIERSAGKAKRVIDRRRP